MYQKSSKEKEKKKGIIIKKSQQKTPANNYYCPELKKIAVLFSVDDSKFEPIETLQGSWVKSSKNLTLDPLNVCNVDCGISIEMPAGYKILVENNPKAFSEGLMVIDYKIIEKRLILTIVNISNEKRAIKSEDIIAKISPTPAYVFDWNRK